MTNKMNHTLVVLKLPMNVPALIKIGQAIIGAMTGNPLFANAVPTVASVDALLTKLDAAETATKMRTKGTVEARDAARLAAVQGLHGLKGFVQQVANASPDDASTIIASAAMGSKKPPLRTKADFAARPGPTTGSVRLAAKASARRASYEWQWSADGGKTWTQAPSTLQARTTLAGIPAATNG
ncbi:MAG TPA: hypothetical protein VIF15_02325, partial [Polyangiaceae bacterium]